MNVNDNFKAAILDARLLGMGGFADQLKGLAEQVNSGTLSTSSPEVKAAFQQADKILQLAQAGKLPRSPVNWAGGDRRDEELFQRVFAMDIWKNLQVVVDSLAPSTPKCVPDENALRHLTEIAKRK